LNRRELIERCERLDAELAETNSDRDRWHKAFLDAKYPEILPTRVDLEKRIAALEAENARLLADVNQDEGYERLKVALREISEGAKISALATYQAIDKARVLLTDLETPARQAHSKSEYKRLTALGVECAAPETGAKHE